MNFCALVVTAAKRAECVYSLQYRCYIRLHETTVSRVSYWLFVVDETISNQLRLPLVLIVSFCL